MGADIECRTCHTTFNTKKNATDRILLNLKINGKVKFTKQGLYNTCQKERKQNDQQKATFIYYRVMP